METFIVKFLLELPNLIVKTVDIATLKDGLKNAGEIIEHLKGRESDLTQMVETFRQKYLSSEKENVDLKKERSELKQENADLKEEIAKLKGV